MKQRRILIIRPDRIGDVVLTTPLIRAVKRSFPGSFVGVMVNSVSGVLLRNNPHIDLLITDDPAGKDAGRSGFWRQVRTLRSHAFDTGLMPLPRERHAWMMALAGIRTRIGVGGKIYQVLTGTKTVSRNKYIPPRHEADYVMDLGRRIGITDDRLIPELFLTPEEKTNADEMYRRHGFDFSQPIIGINPSSNNSSPNWTPERYADLCDRLSDQYRLFINIGIPNATMEKHFRRFSGRHLVYSGTDLRELIALCHRLSVLITSSTGTSHIAAALGVPTVSMFCPLPACSITRWGPLGNSNDTIEPPEGYCQGRCPGDPKICTLDEIDIDSVIERLEKVIKK